MPDGNPVLRVAEASVVRPAHRAVDVRVLPVNFRAALPAGWMVGADFTRPAPVGGQRAAMSVA